MHRGVGTAGTGHGIPAQRHPRDPHSAVDRHRRRGESLVVVVTPDARLRAELVERVAGLAPVLVVSDALGAVEVLAPRDEEPTGPGLPEGLRLDTREHRVTYRDEPMTLSQHEHDLFRLMATDVGRAWTYEKLHHEVWGSAYLPSATDLHSTVKRLRRKLAAAGVPLVIETVRSVGFRLVARAPCAE